MSSLGWDYGSYTHHTNRDSFDKIVFDDLKGNATIVAMLAYLASEDPTTISRDRADLTAARGGGGGGRGRGGRRPAAVRSSSAAAVDEAPAVVAAVRSSTTRAGAPTCPKAPRFFNDSSRVTAPSNRP